MLTCQIVLWKHHQCSRQSHNESQAKYLEVILTSCFLLRANIQLIRKSYWLYFQHWSWEFTISVLGPVFPDSPSNVWDFLVCLPSNLLVSALVLLHSVSTWLKIFEIFKSDHMILLKTSSGFPALRTYVVWCNLTTPDSLPRLWSVSYLCSWLHHSGLFLLFLTAVKLILPWGLCPCCSLCLEDPSPQSLWREAYSNVTSSKKRSLAIL